MGKKSTRVMRRLSKEKSRHRAARPKTFKTEEAAKTWAKTNNVTDFKLKNMKSPESAVKKIKIISK